MNAASRDAAGWAGEFVNAASRDAAGWAGEFVNAASPEIDCKAIGGAAGENDASRAWG